ncbi:hypothetical protein ACVIIV_000169 [Bradyrhizobium sp. USDA 4354]
MVLFTGRTIEHNCIKGGATTTNEALRKAYDNNGLKDSSIRTD